MPPTYYIFDTCYRQRCHRWLFGRYLAAEAHAKAAAFLHDDYLRVTGCYRQFIRASGHGAADADAMLSFLGHRRYVLAASGGD